MDGCTDVLMYVHRIRTFCKWISLKLWITQNQSCVPTLNFHDSTEIVRVAWGLTNSSYILRYTMVWTSRYSIICLVIGEPDSGSMNRLLSRGDVWGLNLNRPSSSCKGFPSLGKVSLGIHPYQRVCTFNSIYSYCNVRFEVYHFPRWAPGYFLWLSYCVGSVTRQDIQRGSVQ